MLDFFSIFSKGGIVLWCYTFQGVKANFTEPINALIKTVLLQERGGNSQFTHGPLQMQYKLDNEFELVFVVGFQKVLTLLYVDKLITDVHRDFRDRYRKKLLDSSLAWITVNFNYDNQFSLLRSNAEVKESNKVTTMRTFDKSGKSQKTIKSMTIDKNKDPKEVETKKKPSTPKAKKPVEGKVDEFDIARNREAMSKRMATGKGAGKGKKTSQKKGKSARIWENGGNSKDAEALDYSGLQNEPLTNGHGEENNITDEQVKSLQIFIELSTCVRNWVNTSSNIQDLEIEEEEMIIEEEAESKSDTKKKIVKMNRMFSGKKSSGGLFSMFRGLVGSKALSKEALQPVLDSMSDHLIGKNVAADIAQKMCDSVSNKLEGKILGTFSTIASTVKQSLNESLVQILTPKRRVDILRDVLEAQRAGKPYVITFCGVNGVGKSTNLAKICFWLMENGFRVLIAACDTFRAGAVEQLRTHKTRLHTLHPPSMHGGRDGVCLFEKGYGKDAAGIAMQAINAAKEQRYDVVLVDTAGRMQDNEPLMRSLAKLITVNTPDLVLFVGEALVGNEAVDQLVKFNQALADYSNSEKPRTIDGIVLTKFDTIDDKVGAAISMTYTTGQPIVFVGTGQSYPDLRSLNAKAVVHALLK
uniref:SRP54-type proteins GTP-binding domain-containing protein n=1 Tax=Ciona savignyi TaxID=51511 RepID=H2YW23_CIOSA